ncbi:hypothetical protein U1769_14880 [Sphingomonas sp. ZT3P38]|uniref:hypothetical protein n=1 Tax=Parasphingomonas zepuensis TaxID=3096161 RepID=UPI002FCB4527
MAQDEEMVSRWSAAAYVTTSLCLLGIVAGIVFLILGDNRNATLAAVAALLGPVLSAGTANRNGWLSASDSDGSLGSARAGILGAWAGLFSCTFAMSSRHGRSIMTRPSYGNRIS